MGLGSGPMLAFPPIPTFSPELFAYMRCPPNQKKPFLKGIEGLLGEGAVQVCVSHLMAETASHCGCVGAQQQWPHSNWVPDTFLVSGRPGQLVSCGSLVQQDRQSETSTNHSLGQMCTCVRCEAQHGNHKAVSAKLQL